MSQNNCCLNITLEDILNLDLWQVRNWKIDETRNIWKKWELHLWKMFCCANL